LVEKLCRTSSEIIELNGKEDDIVSFFFESKAKESHSRPTFLSNKNNRQNNNWSSLSAKSNSADIAGIIYPLAGFDLARS
jgi:hypothetical protein